MSATDINNVEYHILVCEGKSCTKHGSEALWYILKEKLSNKKYKHRIVQSKVHCTGNCKFAPVIMVYPDGIWYKKITPSLLKKMIKKHLKKGTSLAKKHILGTIQSDT